MDGVATSATGISVTTVGSLQVQNCLIRHFTGNGIDFKPGNDAVLSVVSSHVSENGGHGILVQPTGTLPNAKAVFKDVEANHNALHGFFVNANASAATGINGTAVDSVALQNGSGGFAVSSFLGFNASFLVIRSVAAGNGSGLFSSSSSAFLRVSQSTVTGNAVSWSVPQGGSVTSYGDNTIDGNADGNPAPPFVSKK